MSSSTDASKRYGVASKPAAMDESGMTRSGAGLIARSEWNKLPELSSRRCGTPLRWMRLRPLKKLMREIFCATK